MSVSNTSGQVDIIPFQWGKKKKRFVSRSCASFFRATIKLTFSTFNCIGVSKTGGENRYIIENFRGKTKLSALPKLREGEIIRFVSLK